jgi:hypothetical protein
MMCPDFLDTFAQVCEPRLNEIRQLSGEEREKAISDFADECLVRFDAAPINTKSAMEDLIRTSL